MIPTEEKRSGKTRFRTTKIARKCPWHWGNKTTNLQRSRKTGSNPSHRKLNNVMSFMTLATSCLGTYVFWMDGRNRSHIRRVNYKPKAIKTRKDIHSFPPHVAQYARACVCFIDKWCLLLGPQRGFGSPGPCCCEGKVGSPMTDAACRWGVKCLVGILGTRPSAKLSQQAQYTLVWPTWTKAFEFKAFA